MTNLKEVNFGFNQYCGPAVLSALTGKSTDECAAVLTRISGRKEIKAIEVSYLVKAFEALRFTVKREGYTNYSLYTLFTNIVNKDGLYMILIPRHVIAAEVKEGKIYLVDNASKQPIDASGSARLSQKVEQVYSLIPRNPPIYLGPEYEVLHDSYRKIFTIYQINRYEDKTDDNKAKLGEFRYMDFEELKNIKIKLDLAISDLIKEK